MNNFTLKRNEMIDPLLSTADIASSRWRIELKEINRRELIRLGVKTNKNEMSELCTYEGSDLFFSARRQTVHSGRMLCGIMMVP